MATMRLHPCIYRPTIHPIGQTTSTVHALGVSICYFRCRSKPAHPSVLWLPCQSFRTTYSQASAVRQGNCTLLLAQPIQYYRSTVCNWFLNIILHKMRAHRGHPPPYHITLRQRVQSDNRDWSIRLQRGLPG